MRTIQSLLGATLLMAGVAGGALGQVGPAYAGRERREPPPPR